MIRVDVLLVKRGLVSSRERAQLYISEGEIIVDGKKVRKNSEVFPDDAIIEIKKIPWDYVSRGALKLKKLLTETQIDVKGYTCMDVGASTGGFTQILLEAGANKVYAIDVGENQLHEKLKFDERVISLEKTDIRKLNNEDLSEEIDIITVDVSFISLTNILSALLNFTQERTKIAALIKPQFEIGKKRLGKNGVVKNKKARLEAVEKVVNEFKKEGLYIEYFNASPIKGGEGNVEFLALFGKGRDTYSVDVKKIVLDS